MELPTFAPPECSNAVYTSCYCEENIYWLVKRYLTPSEGEPHWDVFTVFISNPTRTVALWNQRVGSPIIWDYHVVLALRERPQVRGESQNKRDTWIYDLDTCMPVPCHWQVYIDHTFPLGTGTPLSYQSRFRVIPGDVYLDNFASDRSHMFRSSLSEEPRYLSEPPPYPIICGAEAEKDGVENNLMSHFVSMTEQGFGTVMDFGVFAVWCS